MQNKSLGYCAAKCFSLHLELFFSFCPWPLINSHHMIIISFFSIQLSNSLFSGYSTRIFATGGASSNPAILRVIADVFDAPVFVLKDTANSACLGCAYRAKHGLERADGKTFWDAVSEAPPHVLVSDPHGDAPDIYDPLTARYKKLEDSIVDKTHLQSKKRKLES